MLFPSTKSELVKCALKKFDTFYPIKSVDGIRLGLIPITIGIMIEARTMLAKHSRMAAKREIGFSGPS